MIIYQIFLIAFSIEEHFALEAKADELDGAAQTAQARRNTLAANSAQAVQAAQDAHTAYNALVAQNPNDPAAQTIAAAQLNQANIDTQTTQNAITAQNHVLTSINQQAQIARTAVTNHDQQALAAQNAPTAYNNRRRGARKEEEVEPSKEEPSKEDIIYHKIRGLRILTLKQSYFGLS